MNVIGEETPVYQPVFEITKQKGAVYSITAAEDIVTPDGTVRVKKGTVVDTVTTDGKGTATSKALYLGKYTVKEDKAPAGMVISDEIHTVELAYAGQEISVTDSATSFYNERQKANITLAKVMERNEDFEIGDNSEILNVTFGLFAESDITAANGDTIPADGLIEIVSVDENGNAAFTADIPFGKYYVKELSTDEHYILNDERHGFEFTYGGQTVKTVEIKANGDEPFTNELIYGSVSGKKVDENGEALGGAVIGLFKTDDVEFTKENATLTTETAEDGSFPQALYSTIPCTPSPSARTAM